MAGPLFRDSRPVKSLKSVKVSFGQEPWDRKSAEAGEVEGNDDMLTVAGKDFDGGVAGIDIAGVILQPDIPTNEAPVISAGGATTLEGSVAEGHPRMKG